MAFSFCALLKFGCFMAAVYYKNGLLCHCPFSCLILYWYDLWIFTLIRFIFRRCLSHFVWLATWTNHPWIEYLNNMYVCSLGCENKHHCTFSHDGTSTSEAMAIEHTWQIMNEYVVVAHGRETWWSIETMLLWPLSYKKCCWAWIKDGIIIFTSFDPIYISDQNS